MFTRSILAYFTTNPCSSPVYKNPYGDCPRKSELRYSITSLKKRFVPDVSSAPTSGNEPFVNVASVGMLPVVNVANFQLVIGH